MNEPRLTPEQFARTFPRYAPEREAELNRLDPEHYAPRSWFSDSKKRAKLQKHVVQVPQSERGADLTARFSALMKSVATEPVDIPAGWGVSEPGIRNPGIEHYASSSGTENVSQRGRGSIHNPRNIVSPRLETPLIRDLEARLAALTAETDRLRKRGGGKAFQATKKKMLAVRHQLDTERSAVARAGGHLTRRIEDFEQHAGRSSRTLAALEKMKQEGKIEARL